MTCAEGKIVRNPAARIATFAQHHMDQLKLNMTPLDLMMETFPKNHPQVWCWHFAFIARRMLSSPSSLLRDDFYPLRLMYELVPRNKL